MISNLTFSIYLYLICLAAYRLSMLVTKYIRASDLAELSSDNILNISRSLILGVTILSLINYILSFNGIALLLNVYISIISLNEKKHKL